MKLIDEKLYIKSDNIEDIRAEYFDYDALQCAPQEIKRVNNNGNRMYAVIDENYNVNYSVSHTTPLRLLPIPHGLLKWYTDNGMKYCKWFLEQSGNYGTYLHSVYARLFLGESYFFDVNDIEADLKKFCFDNDFDFNELAKWYKEEKRDIRKDIYCFKFFVKERDVKPLAVEIPLWTPEFSGVVDWIVEMNWNKKRITAIIDVKSGMKNFYESHEIQLYAQNILVKKCLPNIKVDKVFNFAPSNFRMPPEEGSKFYKLQDQTGSKSGYKWHHLLAMCRKELPEIEVEKESFFSGEVTMETDIKDMIITENIEDDIIQRFKDLKSEEAF
jgi:hypothetical protein